MSRNAFTLIPALLAVTLACAGAVQAGTTTLYRSVDANGVVTYSDTPSPGAQKMAVTPQPAGNQAPAPSGPRVSGQIGQAGISNGTRVAFRYATCEIASPHEEEMLVNTHSVDVRMQLEPSLQSGHSTYLIFDGTRVDGSGTSFALSDVDRGAHTISAVVLDAGGNQVCQTAPVTFYVSQPSLLQPNRPQH